MAERKTTDELKKLLQDCQSDAFSFSEVTLRNHAPDLAAELIELRERERWIPMSESLPQSGDGLPEFVEVVIAEEWRGRSLPGGDPDSPDFASPSGLDVFFVPYLLDKGRKVATHWRPLPCPPSETEEKKGTI